MKKTILAITVLACAWTATMAQAPQIRRGSWKAYDKVTAGDAKLQMNSEAGLNEAMALYKEAEAILNADIQKELANDEPKNSKLAQLYHQNGELQSKFLAPILGQAGAGAAFDTIAFCKYADASITAYNESQAWNIKPNAKGKVKTDKMIAEMNKAMVGNMLMYYYYCGAYMNELGNLKESAANFKKFVDLPAKSPHFTEAEAAEIYQKNAQIYSQARFNLALQYFQLKDWKNAEAAADEALKDTLGVADLYRIKLTAQGEMKDSVAWANTLLEASKRTGDNSFIQILMYNYMQNNKVAEATALAEKLVTESPEDKTAWFTKGSIELNVSKNYEAARESFKKALAIDPDFEDALFYMGSAYINDLYDRSIAGELKYFGTNRALPAKNAASYQKEKALYDKEFALAKDYYSQARPYLEHLRELTPDGAKRWASPLQIVYSNLGEMDKANEMDALLEAANKGL